MRGLPTLRITVPHYYDFGQDRGLVGSNLVNPTAWDAIRDTRSAFGLPGTREEWEKAAGLPEFVERARVVAAVAHDLGATRICSYGVGAAFLELNLLRTAPHLDLVCTDFAPRTVERLRSLFVEATVRLHDLLAEEPIDADLHFLYRVDTEFSNRELRAILGRFAEPVLLVATELLDLRGVIREVRRRARRQATRAGYVRTEASFRALWAATHHDRPLDVHGLAGFVLTPRGRQP